MAKIEHQTLNDRAYAAIKKGLMSGEFKPGVALLTAGRDIPGHTTDVAETTAEYLP